MKYNRIIISGIMAAMVLGGALTGCSDDITVGRSDQSKYEGIGKVYGYLANAIAPNRRIIDLYQEDVTALLTVGLTNKVDHAVDITLTVDESVLAAYNAANKTDHEMFPAELVSIEEEGKVIVAPGFTKADPVEIVIKSSASLTTGKSYALPIRIKSATDGVELTQQQSTYIYYVKAQGNRLDAAKTPDIKIISCMEVNDANPLANGELYLKNSGKPFIDQVIMFSANINFNAETGRVFVHCNPNVRAILDNKDKYLTPLKDKGIKIILGILGNHDIAAVANLTQETAQYFAQELKAYCDAYDLDGIFFDDEYSSAAPGPGFVYPPSAAAAARLAFETKRAMPDKIVQVYIYGLTRSFTTPIDGVNPGDFIDYAIADYGAGASTGNYLGSNIKQMCPYSSEFAQGRFASASSFKTIRNSGYGGHMVFALDPTRSNWQSQINAMNTAAKELFDDEIVWTGVTHKKDW